ncbi:MAG: hypothetical protein K8823_1496 [Cenarchaeum symbiont of Oopsacas minuta]|nr:hypothetical protein [Cenarchaeum symbiont of Oopsacas minuta]
MYIYKLKQFIRLRPYTIMEKNLGFTECDDCGNLYEICQCVCSFCGERDKCECALFDAATGG